jgi:hypothetical protein
VRARVVAVSLCANVANYARDVGNGAVEATAPAGLERAGTD